MFLKVPKGVHYDQKDIKEHTYQVLPENIMDITPDETKLKKCRSTQTELDGELIQEAKRIVENFEKIEKHWKRREEQLKRTILVIGGILILLKITTKVM